MKKSILFIVPFIFLLVFHVSGFARVRSSETTPADALPTALEIPIENAIPQEDGSIILYNENKDQAGNYAEQAASAPIAAAGIDLDWQSAQISNLPICPGETIPVTVKVINYGDTASGYFWVDLWLDEPNTQVCPASGDYFKRVPGLAAGATYDCVFNVSWPTAGQRALRWFIDSYCEVAETNETNNQEIWTQSIENTPDLYISEFTINPANPVAGKPATVSVTVFNRGCAATGAFFIDIYQNRLTDPACSTNGDVFCDVTSGLAEGASYTCTQNITYSAAGAYALSVKADSYCEVSEFSESNNFTTKSINVDPCYPALPEPNLIFTGTYDYTGGDGNKYTRYTLEVTNYASFPDKLFLPAPYLPPCGANPNASRTWVYVYDGDGNLLQTFCAFAESADLQLVSFAVLKCTAPPDKVYIKLVDRACAINYQSNLVAIDTISCGQPINGSLATTDCLISEDSNSYYTDYYTFSGTAGQPVSISMISSAFDTYLILRDPNDVNIAQNNDGGGSTNARIPAGGACFTLPVTGVYTIEASSNYPTVTGAYTLTLDCSCTECTNYDNIRYLVREYYLDILDREPEPEAGTTGPMRYAASRIWASM